MKNAVRLALLCMAATAAPVFAQDASPRCGSANFDQGRNAFTIRNPAADAVNQQCFLTVYPSGARPSEAWQDPVSFLVEGSYVIELSGGGGGGGGGSGSGNGGGGAGAAPARTVQYLAPGLYKLTIGTGGEGGSANGGWTWAGNPTAMTNAYSGQLIAGFQGADVWRQLNQAPGNGRGGVAMAGGTNGRDGSSNFGGDGGASVGSGGSGESVSNNAPAGIGNLGGGGGGGRGGLNADAGGQGGDGFVRLSLSLQQF